MESPELRPLPPLSKQTTTTTELNCGNGEVSSTVDDEEEVFYSPRGSSGGPESFSGTGSGSRRVLTAMAAENFEGRSSGPSSCSCSSSSSPSRAYSISLSPPVDSSPRRPESNSPEPSVMPAPSSPPPPTQLHYSTTTMVNERTSHLSSLSLSPLSSSPLRVPEKIPAASSPRMSYVSHQNVRSPSLSPLSSPPNKTLENNFGASDPNGQWSPLLSSPSLSPERSLEKNPDASPRVSVASDQGRKSPSLSSSSSASPERGSEGFTGTSPIVLNGSDQKRQFLSLSPERDLAKNPDGPSPTISKAFSSSSSSPERGVDGHSAKSSPEVFDHKMQFLSPKRDLVKNPDESPRISNASDLITYDLDPKRQSISSSTPCSSPGRVSENNSDASPRTSNASSDQYPESPVIITSALKPPPLVPPPPPPAPPPPPSRNYWENPSPSTPIGHTMFKPPPLIPPSRPFVFQNPTKVSISPMELPPTSKTMETIEETPKPKLKPLHWDKVRASSDREMVWDQLRSSSFK